MRALVVDSSAPGRIAIHDVPEPVPTDDEMLVSVRAFSLNRGEMRAVGIAADGSRLGWDFAGTVAEDASGFKQGTRVVGLRSTETWAEKVAVSAASLAPLPDAVSFEQAAALATVGVSALRMLRIGSAIKGRRVLISGATGGVGRYAVQLAHLGGAHVTAVVGSSSSRSEGLRELGADQVATGADDVAGRYDLILDSVGGETLGKLFTKLEQRGTLVMFGNTSDTPTTFNVREIYLDGARTYKTFELFFGDEPFGPDLRYLVDLVAHGKIDAQVAGTMPWTEMPDALERLRERSVPGKLVLMVPG